MRHAIPSAILISLLALGACSQPSQRYNNAADTGSSIKVVPAPTAGPNDPANKGRVGAGTGDSDGAAPAK